MPQYTVAGRTFHVSRRAVVFDTNLLIAYFVVGHENHEDATVLVDEVLPDEFDQVLIPMAVAVEAWNMLASRRPAFDIALRLLEWIRDPGHRSVVLPLEPDVFERGCDLSRQLRIDLVDALVMTLITQVNETCAFRPPLPIVTYDRRDFLKAWQTAPLRYGMIDPETLERFDFG